MRRFLIILAFFTLAMSGKSTFAQTVSGSVVGYDPMFWKATLRLTTAQCLELRDINAEFYKSLVTVAINRDKDNLDKTKILALLNDRSERIMNIFSYRQRKKWDKIAEVYKGNIVASVSSTSLSSWANN